MTQDSTVAPEVQAAINSVYQQGFEAGRLRGFKEGINAALAHLRTLSTTTPIDKTDPTSAWMSLSTRIEHLDFTIRTHNCLSREGLHTIGDVLAYSDMQLLDIRYFGTKCLIEVKEKFAAVGYTIREDGMTDPTV